MKETESIVALAEELPLERKLLYCWRDKDVVGGAENLRRAGRPAAAGAGELHQPGEPPAQTVSDAQQRIAEWEQKIGQQALELDFSRNLAAGQGTSPDERRSWRQSVYAVIQAMTQQQGSLGIERMCRAAGVSRARYYGAWQQSAPRQEEAALRDEIQRLSLAHRHYGYRRISVLLKRSGWPVNRLQPRGGRVGRGAASAREPGAGSFEHGAEPTGDRARIADPSFRSRRQYACTDYVSRLDAAGIQPSMSRPACPWDNAMADSFMRTLKKEEVDGRRYRDLAEARASIGRFIDDIYNSERLHSALGYQSPQAFEAN